MADYRIFHDEASRTIVIEGVREVFPEASLTPVYLGGDDIAVRHDGQGWNVIGPISFTRLRRGDNTAFASASDCFSYLDTELKKKYEATEINWTEDNW